MREPDGFERLGALLFRFRGVTPVPFVALFVAAAAPSGYTLALGAPIVVAGELLRLWSVAYAGLGTRGRTIGAEELVTWGAYGHVRNPIYVANFLLCLGFALQSGMGSPTWRGGLGLSLVTAFAVQYAAIVRAEERWLSGRFPEAFERFRAAVPRWLPRLSPGGAPAPGRPRWREALRSERDTLLGLLAITSYLVVRAAVWPVQP